MKECATSENRIQESVRKRYKGLKVLWVSRRQCMGRYLYVVAVFVELLKIVRCSIGYRCE